MALDRSTARDIAANLDRCMKARGWTKTRLASEAGLPPPRISEILAGRFDPRVGTMKKLARALNEPLASLFMPTSEQISTSP